MEKDIYGSPKDSNYFRELQEINEKDPIEQINVNSKDGIKQLKTLDEAKEKLDYDFYGGFGGNEGPDFIAWGVKNIYFPTSYDGAEGIESVPRHPCAFIPYFHHG